MEFPLYKRKNIKSMTSNGFRALILSGDMRNRRYGRNP
jgi:hypothetical protein